MPTDKNNPAHIRLSAERKADCHWTGNPPMLERAILYLKRFSLPMKILGLAFLAFHFATAEIKFNPVWSLVYVAIALTVALACETVRNLARSMRRQALSTRPELGFSGEEKRCIDLMHAQSQRFRARPWKFLLIAGEDGFFFLPLLYLGISVPAVIVAMAIFTAMHYGEKPLYSLLGMFLLCTVNALVVLPHGILAVILGHMLLDAQAFAMAPTLKRWVAADLEQRNAPDGKSAKTVEID